MSRDEMKSNGVLEFVESNENKKKKQTEKHKNKNQ